MVLLTDEEMAPYLPAREFLCGQLIAKAQLKKVVELLKEYRHDCIECGWTITLDHEVWQALLEEVKE